MWTDEPPREAGWYWFRLTDPHVPEEVAKPRMLLVFVAADGSAWAEDTVNGERYPVHVVEGLWAGPLVPPKPSGGLHQPAHTPAHIMRSG